VRCITEYTFRAFGRRYLYDLTRDELQYILDPADVMSGDYPSGTFRVLKNNERGGRCRYIPRTNRQIRVCPW